MRPAGELEPGTMQRQLRALWRPRFSGKVQLMIRKNDESETKSPSAVSSRNAIKLEGPVSMKDILYIHRQCTNVIPYNYNSVA